MIENRFLLRSIELHLILMFLGTIVLVIWQFFGMSLSHVILPGELKASSSVSTNATVFSDEINGGQSLTTLTQSNGQVQIDCQIVLSDTFAFCGASIPLKVKDTKGMDIRRYSNMEVEIDYQSEIVDSLLIYLVNEELSDSSDYVEKSNLWAVSPITGINTFNLSPQQLVLPSWWIFQNRDTGLDMMPHINNVKAIRITTGDNTDARQISISINRIVFTGKWINAESLYFGLLVAWLLLISYHGFYHMHGLTQRYKETKRQNMKLVRLNEFLEIQKSQYEKMAKHDKLTGAWNRVGVRNILRQILESFKMRSTPAALLSMDLDEFKSINDDFGHAVGDKALQELAKLIDTHTREEDYFARWGGEEFVLICPNSDMKAAVKLAEMLRQKIEQATLIDERKITCSIGVAQLHDEDIENWFNRTDEALYRAKGDGRNCVKVAK